MPYQIIPVTPFQQNCSIIWCEKTLKAAVVDPGGDLEKLLTFIENKSLHLEKILLTHAHIDHAGAVADLAELKSLPIIGPHRGDDYWIARLDQQAHMFNFKEAKSFEPTQWLVQGDIIQLGDLVIEARHCPGHTPGHIIFYIAEWSLAIVGDVLFAGSIGRTDFPGGSFEQLDQSIRQQLFTLPPETRFIPGHGPMSTIGHEKQTNPFVSDKSKG